MSEPITKEHLKKYKGWRQLVKMYSESIEEARSAAEFPSARENDGSQHQPRVSGGMPAADRLIDLQREMEESIKESEQNMLKIMRAINNLTDPMEKLVLYARYIDGPGCNPTKWEDVAKRIYSGRDDENAIKSVTRLHGRALLSIAKEEF